MNNAKSARAAISDALEQQDWPALAAAAEQLLAADAGLADFASTARAIAASAIEPATTVAVLSDRTTHAVSSCLPAVMLALGRRAAVYEASFDTWQTEIVDGSSRFSTSGAKLTLLALSTGWLTMPAAFDSENHVDALARRAVDDLAAFWSTAINRTATTLIQHNFVAPIDRPLGRLEARYAWSRRNFVQRVNELLWAHDGVEVRILDVAGLAARLGAAHWLDPRWQFQGTHLFNPSATAEYARALRGTLAAVAGQARKVLVVDLDDTLWGGVVGEVGPRGVVFGPGTAAGEAHLAFATHLRRLRDRGVLLAINSRNDPAIVRETFASHPSMPLRLDDFASVHCHWDSKGPHLRGIARDLNVGLDALVFVDDDGVNVAEARATCPEVVAVQMSADPARHVLDLDRLCLFDTIALTAEDASRPASIAVLSQLRDASASASDLGAFLRGLQLRAGWRRATPEDLPRVEQLFLKTNQFNLTRRSWTRGELEQLGAAGELVAVVELDDRVSKYGIVAAVVGTAAQHQLQIENLVLSCRVFSRGVEHYILNVLRAEAQRRGLASVDGTFVETDRNAYARRFLEQEGLLGAPGAAGWSWRFAPERPPLSTPVCDVAASS